LLWIGIDIMESRMLCIRILVKFSSHPETLLRRLAEVLDEMAANGEMPDDINVFHAAALLGRRFIAVSPAVEWRVFGASCGVSNEAGMCFEDVEVDVRCAALEAVAALLGVKAQQWLLLQHRMLDLPGDVREFGLLCAALGAHVSALGERSGVYLRASIDVHIELLGRLNGEALLPFLSYLKDLVVAPSGIGLSPVRFLADPLVLRLLFSRSVNCEYGVKERAFELIGALCMAEPNAMLESFAKLGTLDGLLSLQDVSSVDIRKLCGMVLRVLGRNSDASAAAALEASPELLERLSILLEETDGSTFRETDELENFRGWLRGVLDDTTYEEI
jgi:hypothetical protein